VPLSSQQPCRGTWKEAFIQGTLRDERGSSGASLSGGSHLGELGGRASLLVTMKNMLSKALDMGVCFHTGPTSGEHRGMVLYLRYLREGEELYI